MRLNDCDRLQQDIWDLCDSDPEGSDLEVRALFQECQDLYSPLAKIFYPNRLHKVWIRILAGFPTTATEYYGIDRN